MRKSFSLIEVLIFISILSVFMVTSASIITVSMHQNSQQISKLKATHYNNQLIEWVRTEKEVDWNNLVAKASSLPNGFVYCFCSETMGWTPASDKADCCPVLLLGQFKRYLILKTSAYAPTGFTATTQVEASVYTDWQEAGNSYSTKLHSLFSPWEE